MSLLYKLDFEEAKTAWGHYWAKDVWKRPLVVCDVHKEGAPESPNTWKEHYWMACKGHWQDYAKRLDQFFQSREFLAESIPYFCFDFGPYQFAAFISGSELEFDAGSKDTNWHSPVIE